MTRAQKQKAERQSTADYAASQRVYDSLRIGFTKVNDQRAELSIARDIAQHLNLGDTSASDPRHEQKHHRSINCAVKAWRSALEIYTDIFQGLAESTKLQSAQSPEDAELHTKLTDIVRSASQAKDVAMSFQLFDLPEEGRSYSEDMNTKSTSLLQEDEDESSDSSSSASEDVEEENPADSTPTNETLLHLLGQGARPHPAKAKEGQPLQPRPSGKISYDSKGGKILWHKGVEKPYVPYGTLGGSQKKEWQAEKRRQKREKKAAKRATKRTTQRANATTTVVEEDTSRPIHDRDYISLNGTSAATSTSYVVPQVEYEDVSAEVESRLKAKEARKEAAKKEKKRKRESGDSFPGDVDGKAEKPSKKKTKAVEAAQAVEGTSQKHERDEEEQIEGEARKKRKKVKS